MKDLVFFIIQNLLTSENDFRGFNKFFKLFSSFLKEKSFSSFFPCKNTLFSLNVLFINFLFSFSIKTPSQNLKNFSFFPLSSPKVFPSLPLQILKLNHLFVDTLKPANINHRHFIFHPLKNSSQTNHYLSKELSIGV